MSKTGQNSGQPSPFHSGEQQVQSQLGVRDIEQWARTVVRDHLPEQHRAFHTSQPFLIASARDDQGRPWVTLLEGADGFVTSPDPRHLVIEAKPAPGDALENAFRLGTDIGILGIELVTRRRNRANGRVATVTDTSFTFELDQSFGNCPQYIRERAWRRLDDSPTPEAQRGDHLSEDQRDWIENADTFFIASGYRGKESNPAFGMDASHRGGDRGFVRVLNERQIRFPDYAGNNHYNTIGNIVLDPRVGFLFVGFETGSLLQLTGNATIDWDSDDLSAFPGARRLITLNIDEVVELSGAIGLRWQVDAESVRSLRLVDRVDESKDVTSFVFEARDGGPLAPFEPGQHLPIELNIPGTDQAVRRTYSLSGSPKDDRYRITVKREDKGLASRFLHDRLEVGAIVESRHPAGEFTTTCEACPLALISAGVGITPMVSMLHAVASADSQRPIWFIHGARDGRHHPLSGEVLKLVEKNPNIKLHIAYSQPRPDDEIGKHFHSRGRISGGQVVELVNMPGAKYYLCGPTAFMAEVQSDLAAVGVSPDNIHTETFGPAAGAGRPAVSP